MGDERAETYLRLLAEAEAVLRQAGDRLRALDAAAGTDVWSDPGMAPFATTESAQWKVGRAARILVAAGVLVDDLGARYTIRFEGGVSRTDTWGGIARLIPVPPRGVRRLDPVGDETRLIQIPLRTSAARGHPAAPPATEPVAVPLGERLLVLAAERILAGEDSRAPTQGPESGQIITVLTETGAIAADSVVPSQLAAVCQRLGTTGHGITVPAATQIPAPWASVLAQRDTPRPADGPEVFAPLAGVLPDLHGARFALAGLSMAAGESHLHAVSSGMPRLAKWFASTTGGPVSPGGSGTTPGTGTWR